ncbi:hypothetical protein AAY473_040527 [Plecturocebus cupreus]
MTRDEYHALLAWKQVNLKKAKACFEWGDAEEPRDNFGGLKWVDHLRPGVREQPGQDGETLSPLKIQKLVGHGGEFYNPSYSGGGHSVIKVRNRKDPEQGVSFARCGKMRITITFKVVQSGEHSDLTLK